MDQINSMISAFTRATDHSKKPFQIENFVNALGEKLDAPGSRFAAPNGLIEQISSEGFEALGNEAKDYTSGLYDALQRELDALGFESFNEKRGDDAARVSRNQLLAASIALMGAQDEARYKKALLSCTKAVISNEDHIINASSQMSGVAGSIPAFGENTSLENYNEKSQRDFRIVTAGYNLNSSRQDAFAEAIYRTTLINPQEGGAVQILPYVAVVKDVFHSVTGARLANEEKNLVDAYRDPSFLEDESTQLIPVVADGGENAAAFVAAADVPVTPIKDARGNTQNTAPLKVGAKFDLIGISNLNQLVAGGILEQSDTIDPAGRLKAVYVKFAGNGTEAAKVIRFTVERLPTATFIPKLVGDTRGAGIDFNSEDIVLDGASKAVDGSSLAGVTELENRKWTIRLGMSLNASLSLSKGFLSSNAGAVSIESLHDEATNTNLDPTAGDAATVIASLGAMTVIGFDLNVRFTNTNRRQRGHLLQTRAVQFRHPIWMHAPITLPLSTMDEQGPGEVAKALTVATDIRNSNNAVVRMLNYLAQLKEVVGTGYSLPKFGAVEGALSMMMRPVYRYAKIDLETAIDTIRSGDRWNDVCSVLLNTVKAELFPAYRDSNIESVFQTISGNSDERPKVLLCTDREIANYLMTSGDDRTLGAYLKYDVVATNNVKFDGKLVVILTRENPVENDILNWGQFYYVPTIVADLPISRNGQISREIAAVPFNLHVNNIPFAIEIDVVGLRKVMSSSMYNSIVGGP